MSSFLQAGWATAVTLALYAIYCFWEASRSDLVHSFRHLAPGQPCASGHGYRARGWWAAAAAVLVALGCLASAL